MHDNCVLTAGRVEFTVEAAGRPKPPGPALSLTLTSTILGRIPVVLASADDLGRLETWECGCPTSYPLEVVSFPLRDLADAMAVRVSFVDIDAWADPGATLALQLELTFGGADDGYRWRAPTVTVNSAVGSSRPVPLPAITR